MDTRPRGEVRLASDPPAPVLHIGVDPGASGGIAMVAGRGGDHVDSFAMPDTETDLWELVASAVYEWEQSGGKCVAVIEQVGGHVGGGPVCPVCKQARNRSPGSSMFKFGRNAGMLTMALIAACVPFEEVQPARWQKAMGVPTRGKGITQNAHKNVLKAKAQSLYPSVKVTLATADALLLATYCLRKHEGTLAR